ncbi:MAG: DNA topoisomerase VI subunit B, partial [Planctomycetes bacterium]|nr:DNA topoisomerase VI subunit B [Planctomycetota bacterium]
TGMVKEQIPNIVGKLLYGSKFHRLKMSRGQQGIGISAAGMYGLLTTGRPIHITSRIARKRDAHHYQIQIDTKKNKPEIIKDETVTVDWKHGTEVTIDLVASYNKGRASVDEYMLQTAIVNPHCSFTYKSPTDSTVEYPRSVDELPPMPIEIKPHPHGVELGMMIKMLGDTTDTYLGGFLRKDFSRIGPNVANRVCKSAGLTTRSYIARLNGQDIERLYKELQKTKLRAPATNCLAPIGTEQILSGLLQGIKAEFFTASTRPPSVYRGNPFQIEVGLAYGGELGRDKDDLPDDNGKQSDPPQTRIIRFANRVPLLYQQSGCCMYKSVVETKWSNYGIPQSRGALPSAPLVILVHIASVWVPFTSESKEAVADYDEIRKEIRLAMQECGRRLGTLLKRKKKKQAFARRRDVFTRYINEVVNATRAIRVINKDAFRHDLIALARRSTEAADMEFDDHGKRIDRRPETHLEYTVVVERDQNSTQESDTLFADAAKATKRTSAKKSKTKKKRKTARR